MSKRDELAALRERVRNAKGEDRLLDREILEALPLPERGWGDIWPECVTWNSLDIGHWAAPITASLDAAVALCARLIPGCMFNMSSFPSVGKCRALVELYYDEGEFSEAPTLPLALLDAILSALIAQQEKADAQPA